MKKLAVLATIAIMALTATTASATETADFYKNLTDSNGIGSVQEY